MILPGLPTWLFIQIIKVFLCVSIGFVIFAYIEIKLLDWLEAREKNRKHKE